MIYVITMNAKFLVKPYRRSFCRPLTTARGVWELREGFLIRMETAQGVGYGEVAPIPDFGSETIDAAGDFLRTLTNGSEATPPANLPACAFALSAASQSIQREKPKQKQYAVCALLPAGAAALPVAEKKIEQGYETLKWKIGVEPLRSELEQACSLFDRLPEGVLLRLDANASLEPSALESWLELLEQFSCQVDYLEQPLPRGQEFLMAEAMQRSGIPIALDESLNGAKAERWMEPGAWAGPLVIKAPLMGEMERLRCRLKPLAGQVVLSSVFETGVGMESAFTLADALPDLERAVGYDTINAFDDAMTQIKEGPIICASQRECYDPEQIWNSI